MKTGKPTGRPRGPERTCIISVRIPESVYQSFQKKIRLLGFENVSDPIKRWITRQTSAPPPATPPPS